MRGEPCLFHRSFYITRGTFDRESCNPSHPCRTGHCSMRGLRRRRRTRQADSSRNRKKQGQEVTNGDRLFAGGLRIREVFYICCGGKGEFACSGGLLKTATERAGAREEILDKSFDWISGMIDCTTKNPRIWVRGPIFQRTFPSLILRSVVFIQLRPVSR